jgi:pimeloyl-ACP methyl ester carboxylesterase
MKRCPSCERTYDDASLNFCRVDGAKLIEGSFEQPTQLIGTSRVSKEVTTSALPKTSDATSSSRPVTKYAKSGDVNIAYQVIGQGPIDIVFVPGWVSHVEYMWDEPSIAQFLNRLASFARVIMFDKRGTGLSDQTTDLPSLEERMDDVRAVMEAARSERAVVFGFSEGGNMSLMFAATYPERTIALIIFGVFAKRVWDPEYPWAPTPEERQKFYDAIEHEWGGPVGIEDLAPSRANDPKFREWWGSYQRRSVSPRAALALARMNTLIDVRHVLPTIRVPTLVLHRVGDHDARVEEGRYIASRIPGAKFVELPGNDHLMFAGNQDEIFDEVETFLKTAQDVPESDSLLATILCARLASANESSQESLKRFRSLAQRESEWFKGRLGNSNDEFVATFDGPGRAVRAACAIRESAAQLGIETRIGLHSGLCQISEKRITGPAVEATGEIAAAAGAGEILASNILVDLLSHAGIQFEEAGIVSPEVGMRLYEVICQGASAE